MTYVTCALTTYGGWGAEFHKQFVLPEYQRRLTAEKQDGGHGWESRRWLQDLYESMSITIARANYDMLRARTLPFGVA